MSEIPGQMTIEDIPIAVDYQDIHNPDCFASSPCVCEPDDYGHFGNCPQSLCICQRLERAASAGRASMKADVLRTLNFLSPICREPMVFSDHPNCNCWLGIQHCIVLVEKL